MPDLKAAAERLRESVALVANEMEFWGVSDIASQQSTARLAQASSDYLLAAQALEALAWLGEQPMSLEKKVDQWRILGRSADGGLLYYYADTPLGALLAAMEGERDGK